MTDKFVPGRDGEILEIGKESFKKEYEQNWEMDKNICPKTKDGMHVFIYDRNFNPTHCKFCKISHLDIK